MGDLQVVYNLRCQNIYFNIEMSSSIGNEKNYIYLVKTVKRGHCQIMVFFFQMLTNAIIGFLGACLSLAMSVILLSCENKLRVTQLTGVGDEEIETDTGGQIED